MFILYKMGTGLPITTVTKKNENYKYLEKHWYAILINKKSFKFIFLPIFYSNIILLQPSILQAYNLTYTLEVTPAHTSTVTLPLCFQSCFHSRDLKVGTPSGPNYSCSPQFPIVLLPSNDSIPSQYPSLTPNLMGGPRDGWCTFPTLGLRRGERNLMTFSKIL